MTREIDVQVATEVFGLVPCTECGDGDFHPAGMVPQCNSQVPICDGLRWYSASLIRAFEVEEWLFERGYVIIFQRLKSGDWYVNAITKGGDGGCGRSAATLPEAICRVALEVARLEREASNG